MISTATDLASVLAAPGLEGVVVAETSIGDVRGLEGFYHYRQYSAVELAAKRSFADVVELLFRGELPTKRASGAAVIPRSLPAGLAAILPQISATGTPLDVLRSAVSLLGAELSWRPILDTSSEELLSQARELCALVPTVLSAVDRLRRDSRRSSPATTSGSRRTTSGCCTARFQRQR